MNALLLLHAIEGLVNSHLLILYIIIFISAVFEGLPIIGAIYPGTTFIVLLSSLIPITKINIWIVLALTFIGGFLGDYIAYLVGLASLKKVEEEVKKEKKVWEWSKNFFDKYGVISIILGRFISISRSFIPYIAGLSKMNNKEFLIANTISGLIWATFHVFLGYFAGRNWRIALRNFNITISVLVGILIIYMIARALLLKKMSDKE